MDKNSVHYSSKSNEWGTPQELYDKLNNKYKFTLDPCCTKENSKCKKFYTKKDNGLSKSWKNEIVFMNPPYGRDIKLWIEKAHYEYLFNNATVVCLIPARTDTSYWHEYIFPNATKIEFLRGRIKFEINGVAKHPAPFPSAIVVFER